MKAEPICPRTYRAAKALAFIVVLFGIALVWQLRDRFDLDGLALAPQSPVAQIHVTSVHDGDTFRIGSERVRVLGMDAPEIGRGANCAAEQRAAERARDYLRMALGLPSLRIERDSHDVYGRTLARVYVAGRDISGLMLAAGLAKPYVQRRHGDWCS